MSIFYKYLGVPVDSSLNMTSLLDECYKKAPSRMNLLAKLRYLMDVNVAKTIYQSMVLSAFTYCGTPTLSHSSTRGQTGLVTQKNRTNSKI